MAAPSSQKAADAPISFVLDDQSPGGTVTTITLYLRPEDLTRSDPSRIATQQTLAGAWIDSWGPGLPSITISGTTGWHQDATGIDGQARFLALKALVFDQWHARRAVAIAGGNDPNLVQLIYADVLNNFAVVVAPINFTLRRSRSRPLLTQYQITMTVTDQTIDQAQYLTVTQTLPAAEATQSLGVASLTQSITDIGNFATNFEQNVISSTILAPIAAFTSTVNGIYSQVTGVLQAGEAVASSVMGAATSITAAGLAAINTVATIAQLPQDAVVAYMGLASSLSNALCVLTNALAPPVTYPDYSDFYGASNCCSTSGGSPISPLANLPNQIATIYAAPGSGPSVNVSPTANIAITALNDSDPVLTPMSSTAALAYLSAINAGVTITPANTAIAA